MGSSTSPSRTSAPTKSRCSWAFPSSSTTRVRSHPSVGTAAEQRKAHRQRLELRGLPEQSIAERNLDGQPVVGDLDLTRIFLPGLLEKLGGIRIVPRGQVGEDHPAGSRLLGNPSRFARGGVAR